MQREAVYHIFTAKEVALRLTAVEGKKSLIMTTPTKTDKKGKIVITFGLFKLKFSNISSFQSIGLIKFP